MGRQFSKLRMQNYLDFLAKNQQTNETIVNLLKDLVKSAKI